MKPNVSAPRRAVSSLPAGREAGVCLHLTSLPGRFGIGELGEAALRFVDFVADAGLAVWQFLPTGPTGYGNSPYQSLSTFAGNELLVDVGRLVEWRLLEAGETSALERLPAGQVDYGGLIPAKHALLERAAARFAKRAPAELRAGYSSFLENNDSAWLANYALYRRLKSVHGERPWTAWKRALRQREPAALAQFASAHAAELDRLKVIQYLFQVQWRELRRHARDRGVWLFGDLPIYVAMDSADAWAGREMLELDAAGRPARVSGVPPDYFSADGQLWGNPLYDWDWHARHGYAWWVRRLAHAAELADLVRIDHFRGFEAYWAIPAGETTAKNGRWEPGPGARLFDALTDALGHLPIVAENLGVITPEVEALRRAYAMPGMAVLQFEVAGGDFDAAACDENTVLYTGTHDNDTTRGWFLGGPGDTRSPGEVRRTQERALAATGGSAATIHRDLVRLAFGSRAGLAMAPLQDYLGLGSEARLNTPGRPRDNWRWRCAGGDLGAGLADSLRAMVAAGDRGRF